MSGNLYQIRSRYEQLVGAYFKVDGPHDNHGVVIRSDKVLSPNSPVQGDWLNLVRGTGHEVKGK